MRSLQCMKCIFVQMCICTVVRTVICTVVCIVVYIYIVEHALYMYVHDLVNLLLVTDKIIFKYY